MRQRATQVSALTFCIFLGARLVFAHSVGETGDDSIPPPLKIEMREAAALVNDLGGAAYPSRGVIDDFKLWPTGSTLKGCFFDGDNRLRDFFVQASKIWTTGTSLTMEFGNAPNYAVCNSGEAKDIRVSFRQPGSWSYVGTDSLRYDLDRPSLNVDYPQRGSWENLDKRELAHLILHELGHALAMEHEHQSPEANCDTEFDWDKIYPYFETKLHWSKQQVDFNMRTKVKELRLRTTSYDKQSIMHYYFAPWMFKRDTSSSCYVGNNLTPSPTDLKLVRATYPRDPADQDDHLQDRANTSSAFLATLNLTVEQLTRIAQELKLLIAPHNRPLSLQFDLGSATGRRGPGAPIPDMKDCGSGTPETASVSCEVATDASGFVLNVNPKP
jgi:hypothetical protein